jgi:hypothetical protein
MSDDKFLERIRNDARQLRYEPKDDAIWTRLPARISERVQARGSVAHLLASWFRPIAVSLTALALAAALSLTWMERSQNVLDTIAASPIDVSVGGDTFSVAD